MNKFYLYLLGFILFTHLSEAQHIDSVQLSGNVPQQAFHAVEINPTFPGGAHAFSMFLGGNLVYPSNALKNKIGGDVMVSFTIEKDGSVIDVTAVSSPSIDLSKEAIRVVSMSPRWKPGMQNGKPVRVQYTTKINFDLDLALKNTKTNYITNAEPSENLGTKKREVINDVEDTIKREYNVVEINPAFPGGIEALDQYIRKKINRPKGAKGKVMVSFVIEKDGSLTDIKTVGDSPKNLNDEAIRIIQTSPKWMPAMQNGKNVRVKYTLPIMFDR